MNREALEHLIIDRRLGELPYDVELLLDAYLLASPDAGSTAQQVESTLSMAKHAMRAPSTDESSLPPFPASCVESALSGRSRQTSRLLRWPVTIAATLALGVFLGTRSNMQTLRDVSQSTPVAFNAVTDDAPGDFWSLSPHQQKTKPSSTSARHVEWSSPLNWPVKGESL